MLDVTGLTISFPSADSGAVMPVDDFNFSIKEGEIAGLTGASGCGKTTFATALLGILEPPGYISKGSAFFVCRSTDTIDLFSLNEKQFRLIRGREIGMIFQDPVASLHPARKIAAQFAEVLRSHNRELLRKECDELAAQWLGEMRFTDPKKILGAYPFELSGGMCQRVTVAMALALRPRLLIADEPATALDAENERQILRLIGEARDRYGTSVILISHDTALVSSVADRVVRMDPSR